ncbi:MAG TPA: hypothetical protein VFO39_15465 [Candidatus Sulfotelmatobacter sp.]|nr:hypothetical protein [Candidatus Sulfotelmatobacter sp.]
MKCRFALLVSVLCAFAVNASALDREAFSITNYDLNVRVEPEQQRLGARGKITLRNDSAQPQKVAVLQISSSLDWRSIKFAEKPLQYVTQPYTSDIDHTGALSEAIINLREAVAPKATVELEIAYEGVIVQDATRFARIGAPEDQALTSDWDQIGPKFTGVRGVGYVAWYPIATEAADLSETNSLFEVLGRWKAREAGAMMHAQIGVAGYGVEPPPVQRLVNSADCPAGYEAAGALQQLGADCTYDLLAATIPAFVVAEYSLVDRSGIDVYYLPGHGASATNYADAAEKLVPFITDWFGKPRAKARMADLPDSNAAPFESGSLLLIPLAAADPKLAGLAAAHQLTHAAFSSPRPWIYEGLAHFAQALYLEQQKGRQAALDYMGLHRSAFLQAEARDTAPRSEDEVTHSLVNASSEELYRTKAMYVWWILRDMIGDAALKKALAAYRPEQDKQPSYFQHLLRGQTKRDLEWFFDDWVYRDRGLPDFKIESAFPRKTLNGSYMVTVTVENLGSAGAEVPVIVRFVGGEASQRLEVHGKSKSVIRIAVAGAPQEVVVNDGSVPESDMANNTFKIESPVADK